METIAEVRVQGTEVERVLGRHVTNATAIDGNSPEEWSFDGANREAVLRCIDEEMTDVLILERTRCLNPRAASSCDQEEYFPHVHTGPVHQRGDVGKLTDIGAHHCRVDLDGIPVHLQFVDRDR